MCLFSEHNITTSEAFFEPEVILFFYNLLLFFAVLPFCVVRKFHHYSEVARSDWWTVVYRNRLYSASLSGIFLSEKLTLLYALCVSIFSNLLLLVQQTRSLLSFNFLFFQNKVWLPIVVYLLDLLSYSFLINTEFMSVLRASWQEFIDSVELLAV